MVVGSNFCDMTLCDVQTHSTTALTFESKEIDEPVLSLDGRFVLVRFWHDVEMSSLTRSYWLKVYSVQTGKVVSKVPVSDHLLKRFQFSQSSRLIVTQCENNDKSQPELSLWRFDTPIAVCVTTIVMKRGDVSRVSCVYNDKFISVLHKHLVPQYALSVYSVKSGEETFYAENYARRLPHSPLHQPYIYAAKRREVEDVTKSYPTCRVDLRTMTETAIDVKLYGWVQFDVSGARAVDSSLQVYDMRTCKLLCKFGDHLQMLHCPAISADGAYVTWFSAEQTRVFVVCVDTCSVIGHVFLHSTPLCIEIGHNDVIVVGCDDGSIMTFDVTDTDAKRDAMRRLYSTRAENKTTRLCQLL